MAIKLSTDIRNAIFTNMDDSNFVEMRIYAFGDGEGPPADADAGVGDGTLIAVIPITWLYGTSGSASFSGQATADLEGTVGYGRILDDYSDVYIQGSAGTSFALADFVTDTLIYLPSDPISVIGHITQPLEEVP